MDIDFIKERSARMEEGSWQDNLPGFPGVRVKVRSSNCPSVRSAIAFALRSKSAEFVGGELPKEVALDIDVEVFSTVGIVDWSGLTLGGEEFKFSEENAKDLLRGSWEFRDAVAIKMRIAAVSFEEQTEKISGN